MVYNLRNQASLYIVASRGHAEYHISFTASLKSKIDSTTINVYLRPKYDKSYGVKRGDN